MLAGATLAGSLLLRSCSAAVLSSSSLGGQLAYILAGLALVVAPWHAYGALVYAPAYVSWKLRRYARSVGGT